MRKDKEQAIVMRKSGMSYSEIMAHMVVPKSTLSDWFRGQKWSNDIAIECAKKARNTSTIRLMVLNTVRGSRLKKVYEEAKQDALVDFEELKYHPLFISGIMSYWAHGDKTSKHIVSMSSSDLAIAKIFRLFIVNVCGVKKIKSRLLLNENHDEQACKAYWIDKTGLKYEEFGKTTRIHGKSIAEVAKINANYGICNIGLSSAYLKSKIMKWIELIAREIGEEKYLGVVN